MRLLVFGGSGRTGRAFVVRAATAGWSVHATGRDPARLAALGGDVAWSALDAGNAPAVLDLVRSVRPTAIVSLIGGPCEGGFVDEIGNIAIADAAAAAGVRRVVQVSSLACGDSRPYASLRLVAAIGLVLDAKTRAEDHLRGLDLDWTIVRPAGLIDGDPSGMGALYDDPRVHGRIGRADLAALLLACLTAEVTVRKVLSAVDRSLLCGPDDARAFALTRAAAPPPVA
ncbi:NAD(P)H-binding protein [Chelatococcus sp. SYSU_G07232]|uniref:NAD(P)H-binding protein n=1 Tax=Chelatococcus albus TaxID=3047466 RepID=A0ABT7AM93_9HYPH|nr:NAD(P)H-binding protein [Chelatococcus sp. SYSU_G07232]MDJ1160072.1 NAD(P)H-binding protein [Chelatococcus sp. SYSU_G07232]